MQRKRAVIIYSGGMDSFTLLHQLLAMGHEVHALSFDYGQRHRKELDFACTECATLGVPHHVFSMPRFGGSSQTDASIPVPEGHFEDISMRQTVVPNRNMIMLALATGYAVSIDAPVVYTAVHAGDHAIYPDCRLEFIRAMNQVTQLANYQPVTIEAPYISVDKAGILKEGLEIGLDYSRTWTCYNGREKPCGKCGSCTERLEAFAKNNAADPLEYE